MFVKEWIIVVACTLTCVSNLFSMWVIRKYHENKPLGMQSILSKVIIFFTKMTSLTITPTLCNICVLQILGPFSRPVAYFSTMLEYVCAIGFYSTLVLSVIVRYCLIFHSPAMASMSETAVLRTLKVLVWIVIVVATITEYCYISSFDNLGSFQLRHIGYSKDNSSLEVGIMAGIFLSVLSSVVLQLRIEVDAIHSNDTQAGKLAKFFKWLRSNNVANEVKNIGYSMKVLRSVITCGALLSLIVIYQLIAGSENFIWHQTIFMSFLFGVVPFIFILKHDGMKNVMNKSICFENSERIFD